MSEEVPQSLKKVKHIILVLSGKGGVGKSSVTTQIALSLVQKNFKVGVLDIDLTGPSLPRMFGMENGKIHQSSNNGWIPVYYDSSKQLSLMSLGFLLNDRGNSVVWRGPKKTAMIRQFLKDVEWEELDYLVIDTPPGTSDEHIAIAEELRYCNNVDGAVIVTTPQLISINDVKKEINFCTKVNFKVLGIIENMSGFICPYCDECTNIFSSGGGENLAKELSLPYLGNVPLNPQFIEMIERQSEIKEKDGKDLIALYSECKLSEIFSLITDKVIENVNK
ncbi:hypothetical protein CANARDRAFT_199066 [[Candida] arabinofermentans NRRL YB-2248]|uniref:Uncharacterized protein n=1 Tax=[Candida] arabinofermentans NRRL YB-2248 TaxID=983967 RepID=A0A1E4T0S2_9ASCO|nr:hypothetical protein CANARDRAFT_199066 [[Candida] arabinofermentans NRRL YB-2248]